MASDIEYKIEKYIHYGQVYSASPATIAKVIASNLDVRERAPQAEVDPMCSFTWENSFGERVRCEQHSHSDFHGPRHTNGQSWVAKGYENSARSPYWVYGSTL